MIVGAIATHYHWDHVGGKPPLPQNFGHSLRVPRIPGLLELSQLAELEKGIFIHEHEEAKLAKTTGIAQDCLQCLQDGSKLFVSESIKLSFIHTPGHSPGGVCILVTDMGEEGKGSSTLLLSGDTLFPGSCGRTDLHDGDAMQMYDSLQNKLALLPDSLKVYPGHAYNGNHTTIAREKQFGLLSPISKTEWANKMMPRSKL